MIEKIRRIVESLGYPFFFGTRDDVYAYINSVRTCVAVYRQGNATGASQSLVFKFKGTHTQKMYYDVFSELKKVLTVGVQRTFFYDDVLEVRCPVMNKVFIGGGGRPTPPVPPGPLYFEAAEANSTVLLMSMLATAPNLEYSTDGETWQEWQHTTADGTHTFDTLTLTAVGDRVYLRGNNPNGFLDLENEGLSFFSMTGKIAAHGNAQSLVDGDTPTLVAKTMPVFSDSIITEEPSDVLVSAPSLPATELAESCYCEMFYGCTGLTQAPSLPATTLAEFCYAGMFYGCTGLTQAPSLPATTLAEFCYYGMFYGCTGLTQAPSLPATTLADHCYVSMFYGCTGLTQAPSLPATTLADHCYASMFQGCTGLTQAPSLPATELEAECYTGMFYECTFAMSSDGTTFNFDFGVTPPATAGEQTFNNYYDLAEWMGNTNGFVTP